MTQERERNDDATSRSLVLTTLRRAADAQTVKQVAATVHLSVATTRFHLTRLEAAGLVRSHPERAARRPGRPTLLYTARRPEAVDADAAYQRLAGVLAEELNAVAGAAGALAAGRAWSRRLAAEAPEPMVGGATTDPVDQIVQLLDDIGFAPAWSDDRRRIELHTCPYLNLARERADVVCTMHLGLIQDRLSASGRPVRVKPVLDGSGPCIVELPTPTATFPPVMSRRS